MKCFAIKLPTLGKDQYIENVPRPITFNRYSGVKIHTTDDMEYIKHYRSKSQINSWLTKYVDRSYNHYVVNQKSYYDEKQNKGAYASQWKISNLKENYTSAKRIHNILSKAEIEEFDVKTPTFERKINIRWLDIDCYRKVNLDLICENSSRRSCSSCGIILKNIPYIELRYANGARICTTCLELMDERVKKAHESIPEDTRELIRNEIIINSI